MKTCVLKLQRRAGCRAFDVREGKTKVDPLKGEARWRCEIDNSGYSCGKLEDSRGIRGLGTRMRCLRLKVRVRVSWQRRSAWRLPRYGDTNGVHGSWGMGGGVVDGGEVADAGREGGCTEDV